MRKKRLDDILLNQTSVTEGQIKIALKHQKIYGGKFGSLLMHHGFVDEDSLVKALATQYDCEGVVLSHLEIDDSILNMISAELAVSRALVPFEYNKKEQILKVACEEPNNEELRNELIFATSIDTVQLYIAAELAIVDIIEEHYKPLLDEEDLTRSPYSASSKISIDLVNESVSSIDNDFDITQRTAMLVTDDENFSPFVKLLLEEDNFEVIVVDNVHDAIDMLEGKKYFAVFIKDTVSGDYLDLIDRIRKKTPDTLVRYFESATGLLLNDFQNLTENSLLEKNLEIFTSLLSIKENLNSNHSGRVGEYAIKLCQRMGIPPTERAQICNAGFIHDLAKFYFPSCKNAGYRIQIDKTIKLLKSLNYDPVVIVMLKSMYINLKKKYTKRLPIEILGGNILTIADLFCDTIPSDQQLTLDKFGLLKKKLYDMVGNLFLEEVVDAFISLLQKEMFNSRASKRFSQVFIYSNVPESTYPIETHLKKERFRTISVNSTETFVKLYTRSKPDLVVLHLLTDPDSIIATIENLSKNGIDFSTIPTLLLVDNEHINQLSSLFSTGIEDIMDYLTNHDFIILKIKKIRDRAIEMNEKQRAIIKGETITKGNLKDLNLIDLLQALGPSRRTSKITIKPYDSENEHLDIFLANGNIIYAKLNELIGAEAVYSALNWNDGIWTVEVVRHDKLPEPNNEIPNESILMEGCRLIDERNQKVTVK